MSSTGRCDRHPRTDTRPSARARGYDSAWERLRLAVLQQEPLCRLCGRAKSSHVDHRIPLARGGTNERSNLQGLCRRCHGAKTAALDGAFGNPVRPGTFFFQGGQPERTESPGFSQRRKMGSRFSDTP